MKILHLLYESRGDVYGIGGVGIRAYELYRRLKDRHDITLLCKKYPGARDAEIEGLRHIFAGTESSSLTVTLLSYAFHSSRFVRKYGGEYDVIIEEFSPGIPTLLSFYKKRPVVLQIQGYTGKKYFEKYNPFFSGILYVFERFLPLFYEDYIIVSEETGKRYGLEASGNNIGIISNGISEELFALKPAESDYILYLGRLDIHHKGLDLLLNSYEQFFDRFPGIRLCIAGDGKDRQDFQALIEKMPSAVRKNIEMKGWVEGERKNVLLKDALMVVIPSRYETQGIVALEAMAGGKAIVCSGIPELGYITESGAGISFKPGDAYALASAMKTLMSAGDRPVMGRKGREWVRRFTWGKISLDYENFLRGVLTAWNRQKK